MTYPHYLAARGENRPRQNRVVHPDLLRIRPVEVERTEDTVVGAVEPILTIAQDLGSRLEDMPPASDGQAIRELQDGRRGNAIAAAGSDAAGISDGQEGKARTGTVPSWNTKLLREISDVARVRRQARGSGAVHARARFV